MNKKRNYKGNPRGNKGQRGTTPIRHQKSQQKILAGDQVEGRQAVRELLIAGTRKTREVFLAGDLDDAPILDDIIDLADEAKVPIKEIPRGRFESMAKTESPQGVVALAAPLPNYEIEELIDSKVSASKPFLLVVDGVTDPGNLGAILRSAECAGITGVILPRHRSARVTPAVTKTAAGAIEHLRIATASGIPAALGRLRESGIWIVGLDAGGSTPLYDLQIADQPIALVLGSEGRGLSRLTRERCDELVHIPLKGVLASLNVSTAAAIAAFEVSRHR
ncbi:MAG: 23S rRNA (guanosine(2251)-2'-O)-methyltransferase RlmB [Dehalococcoidia bacterium]|nr:23S rRNA (guanosine(2251)-2'-O)-methyltransferase RlmB [Dehalococcoidia bacterium]